MLGQLLCTVNTKPVQHFASVVRHSSQPNAKDGTTVPSEDTWGYSQMFSFCRLVCPVIAPLEAPPWGLAQDPL